MTSDGGDDDIAVLAFEWTAPEHLTESPTTVRATRACSTAAGRRRDVPVEEAADLGALELGDPVGERRRWAQCTVPTSRVPTQGEPRHMIESGHARRPAGAGVQLRAASTAGYRKARRRPVRWVVPPDTRIQMSRTMTAPITDPIRPDG